MRTTFTAIAAALSFAACNNPAPPKASPTPAAAQPQAPQTPRLMTGVGNHHHAIATGSAEAQQYFDQGFNLVFGFNHEEAARSFRRAAELDPKAPMPHWGIAWALGPNYNRDVDDDRGKQANQAIAQALALSTGGPEAERAYIEAMAIRFPQTRSPIARRWRASIRTRCGICHGDTRTTWTPRRSMRRA